jgi:hypothetical protein
MSGTRRNAAAAGVFFLVAAFPAMAALALYQPLLDDPDYVLGSGGSSAVLFGAFLELLVAVSVIGTSVALYPVVRRQDATIALGYVCGRVVEAVFILIGVLGVLSVVTLRQDAAGPDDSLVAVSRALVALHDWTFLLGPGLFVGANTLMLAWLMHRSRLVPRWIPAIGLVAGPLVTVSGLAELFGVYDQVSAVAAIAAAPVFVWEMSLAGYLLIKGFRPAPLLDALGSPVDGPAALTPA